jgi:uncharacterized protein
MSDDVLRGIGANLLTSQYVSDTVTVCWHSGEPLVLPLSYYRNAIEQLDKYKPPRLTLVHVFQTNGILVTEEWARFLAEVGAHVGLSIDGPAAIHDQMRVTRTGRGTHTAVMRGLTLLRSVGLHPNAICVITMHSVKQPDLIFDFFETHEFCRIAFNFEETVGNHNNAQFGDDIQALVESFLYRYIMLIHHNNSKQSIRDVEQIAQYVFSKETDRRGRYASITEAFGHISVDAEGNFWTFSPELGSSQQGTEFYLGNCRLDHLETVAISQRFHKMREAVEQGMNICRRDCEYFWICGGGSPAHKLAASGRVDVGETPFCQLAIKAPTNVLTSIMMENMNSG